MSDFSGYRWQYKGRWRKALPLPWHTLLRLHVIRQIDNTAYWLVCRNHCDAARYLYQMTGLWRTRTRRNEQV